MSYYSLHKTNIDIYTTKNVYILYPICVHGLNFPIHKHTCTYAGWCPESNGKEVYIYNDNFMAILIFH